MPGALDLPVVAVVAGIVIMLISLGDKIVAGNVRQPNDSREGTRYFFLRKVLRVCRSFWFLAEGAFGARIAQLDGSPPVEQNAAAAT